VQPSPATAREAAERNAEAVVAGNFAQVMASVTPEALMQMMQMGASGGLAPTQMPGVTGYELVEAGQTEDGEGEMFQVTFASSAGSATLETTWRLVAGDWKVTAIRLVSAEGAPPADV